jgi:hypothetical protein
LPGKEKFGFIYTYSAMQQNDKQNPTDKEDLIGISKQTN